MRKKTLWLSLALLISSMALIAAGCGGSDDNASGTTTGAGGTEAAKQVITVNWGTEPPSLDPGLATDVTSSNILLNIMDPLVKLDKDLKPQPSAAESFETSADGKTVTFVLKDGLKWTNGDPVTANDFEYSWKRTISPELGADYAYQFYGIVGAQEYNSCDPKKDQCAALADKVGVKAVDDKTLEVKLTNPQPWFTQQVAHHSFLAVNKKAVDQFGEKWTEAANIVTNGPFKLAKWEHNSAIDIVKNPDWRDAASVKLTRVNGRLIADGLTAVQAFEAGEIDVLQGGLPTDEMSRLKELPTYQQYPGLGTYYEGFNVKNVPDVKQRRAMSLAINRRSIIDNIAQADQLPATGFTPKGMPGFDVINPNSPWMPEEGDIEQAKQLMSEVANPVKDLTFYVNDSPGHREIAVAIQSAWKQELGISTTIKQQEFQQYLEFLGPPPNKDVDVYRLGWIGDFVDAINFLDLWTCKSGNNNTNYCNPKYDEVIEKAKLTEDNDARYKLYAEAEDIMFGENGDMPTIPIYFYTYTALERENVKDSYETNLLDQVDLTKVVVTE
ncbi:MAG: oligopeptide transport system substrate-binding protein [Gaiellaceae bacterium]|jgi:oligopeptide transport system substrate-binding protein|nr:oligopeptide transport system substrate-binding protein [Gaiellaceae bacterium]